MLSCKLNGLLFIAVFFIHISLSFAQDANTYLSNGKKKSQVGGYEEAIIDFTNALRLNPQLEEVYFYRGEAYYKTARYVDAQNDFDKAIQLNPKEAMNYHARGLTKFALKNYQDALWDYNNAIKISPGFEAYFADRANAYRKLKRHSKALADCNKALSISNNYAKALSIRGLVYMEQGDRSEALKDLTTAVKYQANDAELHTNLADYYSEIGQTEKSVEEYTAAINLNPTDSKTYFNRAVLRLSLKSYGNAQRDANKAIQLNRRFLEAYVIRGIASYNLGEYPRFEYDFNHYLKNANNASDFYYVAAHVFQYGKDNGILAKSENWALKAVSMEDSYENNLLYANILFKLSKTTLARVAAEKSFEIAKKNKEEDNSKALYLIAKIDKESSDKTPPVIRITSPLLSANRGVIVVESADKITVMGQVNDESGIAKVLVNGNLARLENGNFDGETILSKEENMITVEAFDNRGNTSQKVFAVKKQNQKKEEIIHPVVSNKTMGTHRALLFATNKYDTWDELINPIFDAKTIAKDLEEIYGFKVELLENPSKDDIILKLKSYVKMQYESNDQLLIFFAGHGQFDEIFREGYVVAKDSRYDDEAKTTYISHSNLRTYINNIPCKHILLTMDVCFGGTFDPLIARRGEASNFTTDREELINRKLRYTTRLYLTSGGKEYVPDGRAGKHSPFARQFLAALRNEGGSDRILTLSEIIDSVANVNPKPRSGEFGNNEPGSDFIFIAK